jgi:ankyrin repeat protein
MLVNCTDHNCTTDAYWHYTPLMYAAANGDMEMVRLLLVGGASVDMANDKTWTALHVAAWFGHLDVCRLLLDWGANVNVVNEWNNTPLYWAAWAGKLDVVKFLVERGADVRLKNIDGETASEKARREGQSFVADWLDARVL